MQYGLGVVFGDVAPAQPLRHLRLRLLDVAARAVNLPGDREKRAELLFDEVVCCPNPIERGEHDDVGPVGFPERQAQAFLSAAAPRRRLFQ